MKSKVRRIFFHISGENLEKISVLARNKGVSKSKLLNSWIASTSELFIHKQVYRAESLSKSFNFRISEQNQLILHKFIAGLGVQQSEILRRIIQSNIKLLHVKKRVYSQINAQDSLKRIDSQMSRGEFAYALQTIENILDTSVSKIIRDNLNLKKAEISNWNRNPSQSKSIISELLNSDNQLNEVNLGKAYVELGVAYMLEYNLFLAKKFVEDGSAILGKTHHFKEYIRSLFHLSKIQMLAGNIFKAQTILDSIGNYVEILDDPLLKAWYLSSHTIGSFYQEEYNEVIYSNRRALSINRNYISAKELHYIYTNLGLSYTMQGKFNTALNNLSKAAHFEQKFRPRVRFSKSKVISMYIYSFYNFEKALDEFISYRKSIGKAYSHLLDYIYSSMLYINGASKEVRMQGEAKLHSILHRSAADSVQEITNAAKTTLQRKSIAPVGYR